MALIDVTALLSDPDFVDPIQLVYRTPVINSFGENLIDEAPICSIGSVQPASGSTLERLPEAMRLLEVASFWYKGLITTSSPGVYSCILVFKGKRYQVMQVNDWLNYGAGWSQGTCVQERPS